MVRFIIRTIISRYLVRMHLHSNMVRFIIKNAGELFMVNEKFTFQYG